MSVMVTAAMIDCGAIVLDDAERQRLHTFTAIYGQVIPNIHPRTNADIGQAISMMHERIDDGDMRAFVKLYCDVNFRVVNDLLDSVDRFYSLPNMGEHASDALHTLESWHSKIDQLEDGYELMDAEMCSAVLERQQYNGRLQ